MTFVKGRQILDVILIANEAFDYWKVKKVKGFVIKLNIEKAFDKISWAFIDFMLQIFIFFFFGEMEEMDKSLHIECSLFNLDKWKASGAD